MSLIVDVKKQLGDFQLNVSFEAGRERLALLGASGCGKSVTLRCIAGILRPDSGHIELDGQVLYDSARRIDLPPQKRRIGYLFQQYALFPNMSVRQNIGAVVPRGRDRGRVTEDLVRRFHLEDVASLRPHQLSGGQQQRTALARILASEPRALLLDEPFSALDSYLKAQLELELLDFLESFSGSVLWVSHDRGEAWRNCPRVCVIDGGSSMPVKTMEELFHSPVTESAARLSGCKNYAAAQPLGERVRIPQWNTELRCAGIAPPELRVVGIRSHHVHPARDGELNQIPCTVVRVIDDVFSTVVLLRPEGSAPDAPLVRMELPKEIWARLPDREHLVVAVAPEDILLLK